MAADPSSNTAPAPTPSEVETKARDPLDPLGWEVPVVCKDCDKEFMVPYRHFQAGVVFHCPHCHGSYVPTVPMYRQVHDTCESFHARMQQEMAQQGTEAAFSQILERELAQFQEALRQLARTLRPAGKLVRRKGLAAMFT